MMTLSMASIGEENTIKRIIGRDEVRQHLAEMGFAVGEKVRVVNAVGGSVILSVKDTRVALDKRVVARILV